jgi:hypothetical protein
MESLEGVRKILIHRKRPDLAHFLRQSRLELDESDTYGSRLFSRITTAEIHAPLEDYEHLRALSQSDRDMILQALLEIHPPKDYDPEITQLEFRVDQRALGAYIITDEELLEEIDAQRSLMIAVATGGPPIKTVNQEYIERREWIQSALKERGLRDPNPYFDLWRWYGKWSSGDLPTYQSRRECISDIYEPLIERIKQGGLTRGAEVFDGPSGWVRVDRGLDEIRRRLEEASTEEQFQTVGLLCREALISLAQTVYDSSRHTPMDRTDPSETDAKRMLEAYLANELAGGTNEAARRHAKAALALANDLQHRRTATFRQAALCAEATTSVVNLIAIISGRRNP